MKTKSNKRSDLINLALGIAIIALLNVLGQYLFFRVDLTAEKRYTLSESTREMLENLDDVVFFKIYLEGEFPQGAGGFKRLRDETRIMLDEFRAYAGDNIQYEFINPAENPDKKQREAFQQQLIEKGVRQFNLEVPSEDGGMSNMPIFPGAIASYHGKEVALPLLSTRRATSPEEQLNNSVQGLEYELSNAVQKLRMKFKPRVAFIQGHGEPDSLQVAEFANALKEYYEVEYVPLFNRIGALRDTMQQADQIRNKYHAVIVASPDTAFSEQEIFLMDQFVMYGGKVLWLIDPVYMNMDTMALTGATMGMPNKLGIEELLFRYGARLNTTLVQDMYCGPIAINVAPPGTPPRIDRRPWVFYPLILPEEKHPIVKNLDAIRFNYLSTVDTIETASPIRKSILLRASKASRVVNTPTRISLAMTRFQPDKRMFNKPYEPVAVLLEGSFDSYFKNKYLPEDFKKNKIIGYKEKSKPTKMIVVGDGDVCINDIKQGQPLPLGFDRNSGQTFANKDFLLNCMNYLTDDKGLLSVRSREVTLRLLDRAKIKDRRLKWQMINTLVPLFIVIGFGVFSFWLRKRRYAR
ncbi:MAG: gliding motility-associated ABC transporter substrate-binding protein GldG [Bacteroidia bacterium]